MSRGIFARELLRGAIEGQASLRQRLSWARLARDEARRALEALDRETAEMTALRDHAVRVLQDLTREAKDEPAKGQQAPQYAGAARHDA